MYISNFIKPFECALYRDGVNVFGQRFLRDAADFTVQQTCVDQQVHKTTFIVHTKICTANNILQY